MISTAQIPFEQIVEIELQGMATESHIEILESDLDLWKDELVAKLQACDREMAVRRAESMRIGTWPARKAYEAWKAKELERKHLIIHRLKDVKLLVRDENVEKYGDRFEALEQLRFEMQKITGLLERIVSMMENHQ